VSKTIRSTAVLDPEERGGPVEVCDHITLPTAYPDRGVGEYGVFLAITCDECGKTYEFTLNVN